MPDIAAGGDAADAAQLLPSVGGHEKADAIGAVGVKAGVSLQRRKLHSKTHGGHTERTQLVTDARLQPLCGLLPGLAEFCGLFAAESLGLSQLLLELCAAFVGVLDVVQFLPTGSQMLDESVLIPIVLSLQFGQK